LKKYSHVTLTILEILFYFSLQWSQGKAKFSCLYGCNTTRTFAYFTYPLEKSSNKKNDNKILKKETSGILPLISLPGLSVVYEISMF